MDDIGNLKSTLRSLVVSKPTEVDLNTLLRDYHLMIGHPFPNVKYGYRRALDFLKERCSDCFLFQGLPSNPVLTLIVPKELKHIDNAVQRQKASSSGKFKGYKRRSVLDTDLSHKESNMVSTTFNDYRNKNNKIEQTRNVERTSNDNNIINENGIVDAKSKSSESPLPQPKPTSNISTSTPNRSEGGTGNLKIENYSRITLSNFHKKRTLLDSSSQNLHSEKSYADDDSKNTSESGRLTASSGSSSKSRQLDDLKQEVKQIILDSPDGVLCSDLFKLYGERYSHELNFTRFGYTSIVSFAAELGEEVVATRPEDGSDWLLRDRARAPAACAPRPRRLRALAPHAPRPPADPEDALPDIEFDRDVFPEDCMHFIDSIPLEPLDAVQAGDMLGVMVGEVYSPSHFWVVRLGERYNIAMEDMMDEMTKYYTHGEGRTRTLAEGAVRVGHYCSSLYDGDWHRSIIVSVLDSDTVKVRHVDYGTVERVCARDLKPLVRQWAALPAQARRARLWGARPAAAARRWPHAAAATFLALVSDKHLVAAVVDIDREEDIMEVQLIDTTQAQDVYICEELVRGGHAAPSGDSALRVSAPLAPAGSSDDESEPLDVRSLASTIARYRGYDDAPHCCEDAASDVSASASEVVGRAPRRLKEWRCPSDVTSTTASSEHLARLRTLHARLRVARHEAPLIHIGSEIPADSTISPNSTVSSDSTVCSALQRRLQVARREVPVVRNGSEITADSIVSPDSIVSSDSTVCSALQRRLQVARREAPVVRNDSEKTADSIVSPDSIVSSDSTVCSALQRRLQVARREAPVVRNGSEITADSIVSPDSIVSSDSTVCSALQRRLQVARREAPVVRNDSEKTADSIVSPDSTVCSVLQRRLQVSLLCEGRRRALAAGDASPDSTTSSATVRSHFLQHKIALAARLKPA